MTQQEPPDSGPERNRPPEQPVSPQDAPAHAPTSGSKPSHGVDPWRIWLHRAQHTTVGHGLGFPVPAWLRPTRGEHRWPITLSVAAAIVLQYFLPPHLNSVISRPVMLGLECALLVGVIVADPFRVERGGTARRTATIVLIFLVTFGNAASAVLLIRAILDGTAGNSATPLFASGASIWVTNVIAFGLWYWQFDRGGPIDRMQGTRRYPDLLFPQMSTPELAPPEWEPQFVDYLYTSFTNATAFSPTDVMPLAKWAKLTFLVQSAVSLAIAALVIARAVNILKT